MRLLCDTVLDLQYRSADASRIMRTSGCKSYAGLSVEVISLISLATSFLMFKALSGVAVDFYILYAYSFQTCIFVSYALLRCKTTDVTVSLYSEKYLHLARAVIGVVSFIFMSISLRTIPAADTSAVMKSTPVLVTVWAYFFLKERFGVPRIFVLLLTVGGVFLICRPTFLFESSDDPTERLIGTLCAVAASVTLSFVYVLQRKIRKTPVVITAITNASVSCVLLTPSIIVRSSWETVNCNHALMIFICSVLVLVGLLMKFAASRMEEASRLALVSVIDLPYTLLCEIAFFGVEPPWTSYVGAGVITISVGLVILLKRRETALPPIKPVKEKDTELPRSKCDRNPQELSVESETLV